MHSSVGLAYLIVVQLLAANNGELLLFREEQDPNAEGKKLDNYVQYNNNEIERLPVPVDSFGELNKIQVNVQNDNHSHVGGFFCYRYQMTSSPNSKKEKVIEDVLIESQKNLLVRGAEDLLKLSIVPRYWAVQFDAQSAIFIQKRQGDDRKLAASDEGHFNVHYKSKI